MQTNVRAKTGSIEETISDTLDRCERSQPDLNAFARIDREGALATARKLDAGESSGKLAGIPISVKDILNVGGLPTNWGSRTRCRTRSPVAADTIAVARGSALAGAGPHRQEHDHMNLAHTMMGSSPLTGLTLTVNPLECRHNLRQIELRRRRLRRRRPRSDGAVHRCRRIDTLAGGLHRRARVEADTRPHSA